MSPLLALDAIDRAIGELLVGLPVQRHPDRKAARAVVSNNLDAAHRLAPGPLSYGLQTLLSESPVVHSNLFLIRHVSIRAKKDRRSRVVATVKVWAVNHPSEETGRSTAPRRNFACAFRAAGPRRKSPRRAHYFTTRNPNPCSSRSAAATTSSRSMISSMRWSVASALMRGPGSI
jgi:hypothetical protein